MGPTEVIFTAVSVLWIFVLTLVTAVARRFSFSQSMTALAVLLSVYIPVFLSASTGLDHWEKSIWESIAIAALLTAVYAHSREYQPRSRTRTEVQPAIPSNIFTGNLPDAVHSAMYRAAGDKRGVDKPTVPNASSVSSGVLSPYISSFFLRAGAHQHTSMPSAVVSGQPSDGVPIPISPSTPNVIQNASADAKEKPLVRVKGAAEYLQELGHVGNGLPPPMEVTVVTAEQHFTVAQHTSFEQHTVRVPNSSRTNVAAPSDLPPLYAPSAPYNVVSTSSVDNNSELTSSMCFTYNLSQFDTVLMLAVFVVPAIIVSFAYDIDVVSCWYAHRGVRTLWFVFSLVASVVNAIRTIRIHNRLYKAVVGASLVTMVTYVCVMWALPKTYSSVAAIAGIHLLLASITVIQCKYPHRSTQQGRQSGFSNQVAPASPRAPAPTLAAASPSLAAFTNADNGFSAAEWTDSMFPTTTPGPSFLYMLAQHVVETRPVYMPTTEALLMFSWALDGLQPEQIRKCLTPGSFSSALRQLQRKIVSDSADANVVAYGRRDLSLVAVLLVCVPLGRNFLKDMLTAQDCPEILLCLLDIHQYCQHLLQSYRKALSALAVISSRMRRETSQNSPKFAGTPQTPYLHHTLGSGDMLTDAYTNTPSVLAESDREATQDSGLGLLQLSAAASVVDPMVLQSLREQLTNAENIVRVYCSDENSAHLPVNVSSNTRRRVQSVLLRMAAALKAWHNNQAPAFSATTSSPRPLQNVQALHVAALDLYDVFAGVVAELIQLIACGPLIHHSSSPALHDCIAQMLSAIRKDVCPPQEGSFLRE